MTSRSASPLLVWAGIVTLYVVWGSTYLAIRVAVGSIPPFLMAGIRFVAAGTLLTAAVWAWGRGSVRLPNRREAIDSAIVGALLLIGGMGMVSLAETTVPSGIAALLAGLMPMWLGMFTRIVFGERMARGAVAGTIVGLAGVALLVGPTLATGGAEAPGLIALLVSPMSWAAGSLYAARRAVLPRPALMASGAEMLLGGLLLLAVAAVTGEVGGFSPAAVTPDAWLGLLYLTTVGSLVGFVTFAWLVGEALDLRTIAGAVVVVAGVVLIVSATRQPSRERESVPAAEPVRSAG